MSEQLPEGIDLAQELRELGRQLKEAIRVAREHPQTKEFERQVSQAVGELSAHIDRAVKTAKEDEHIRKAAETTEAEVRRAAQTLKESGAKEDIARGLAKGLQALNEQIRRAIAEAEKTSRGPKQD
jgi:Xaa-Pro aminopeptidase